MSLDATTDFVFLIAISAKHLAIVCLVNVTIQTAYMYRATRFSHTCGLRIQSFMKLFGLKPCLCLDLFLICLEIGLLKGIADLWKHIQQGECGFD